MFEIFRFSLLTRFLIAFLYTTLLKWKCVSWILKIRLIWTLTNALIETKDTLERAHRRWGTLARKNNWRSFAWGLHRGKHFQTALTIIAQYPIQTHQWMSVFHCILWHMSPLWTAQETTFESTLMLKVGPGITSKGRPAADIIWLCLSGDAFRGTGPRAPREGLSALQPFNHWCNEPGTHRYFLSLGASLARDDAVPSFNAKGCWFTPLDYH